MARRIRALRPEYAHPTRETQRGENPDAGSLLWHHNFIKPRVGCGWFKHLLQMIQVKLTRAIRSPARTHRQRPAMGKPLGAQAVAALDALGLVARGLEVAGLVAGKIEFKRAKSVTMPWRLTDRSRASEPSGGVCQDTSGGVGGTFGHSVKNIFRRLHPSQRMNAS
jgi:hypothetical protein